MKGIDYTDGTLNPVTIVAKGYGFVGRYLSFSPWKTITPREAQGLRNAGLPVVLVWETTEQRSAQGMAAGQADAEAALQETKTLGFNDPGAIYFAVDYEFSLATLGGPIADYFRGVGKVLPVTQIGVYGGFATVNSLLDAGLVTYSWQTLAWSHGKWEPRNNIQQYNTGSNMVGGVPCDLNESMTDDFGQWT